jgi:Trm5-related predicted tRNA methylase
MKNEVEYIENFDYEVLTKEGFKDFKGITTAKKQCMRLTLENGEFIELTPEHNVIVEGEKKATKDFVIGDCVDYKNTKKKISKIEYIADKNVCDLVSVEDVHSFWCNNINISNCCFIDDCCI